MSLLLYIASLVTTSGSFSTKLLFETQYISLEIHFILPALKFLNGAQYVALK
jgi:hypothetical protein